MRLDFNVLWVEDNQKYVQSQIDPIKRAMKNEGFRLQVVFAKSLDEARQYIFEDIYSDHIDLILMDYDLGAGEFGDVGLLEVRKRLPYRDIIFYSAQGGNLQEKVSAKKVSGVYCSVRDDLPDTVIGVFELLVKKVLDIDHSRGIVLGATSDIDQYVNGCLVTIFNSSDAACKKRTLDKLASHVKEKRKGFNKEADLIEAVSHVSELFDKHAVYTSNDRLRLLINSLEYNKNSCESINENSIIQAKEYQKTVPKRNLLAHVTPRVEGFSRKLYDKEGKELTSEDMKNLRQELLLYHDFFEALLEKLKTHSIQNQT